MHQLINRLDALKIRRATRPGYHADGAGLYLQVSGGDARSWICRFTINGRTRDMSLGSAVTFNLAQARQAALEARKLQAVGIDPIEHRRSQRAQKRARDIRVVTFRQEAEAYINVHRSSWKNAKHAEQWRSTLEVYAYPVIGEVPVGELIGLKNIVVLNDEAHHRYRERPQVEEEKLKGEKKEEAERNNEAARP